MPTRLPPGDPRSWDAQRERTLRTLSATAQKFVALSKLSKLALRTHANTLLWLGRSLRQFPEITIIGWPEIPLPERFDALSHLADRLVRRWQVQSREVKLRVALRQRATEAGCSVPAIKRQALMSAAWIVINDEIYTPQRSRLASSWLVDKTGRRVVVAPQEWADRDARRWIISETMKMAKAWVLDTAGASLDDSSHVPLDAVDDAMLFRLVHADDDTDGLDQRLRIVSEVATPAEYELWSAMLTRLKAQDGRIHGARAAAARVLGKNPRTARVQWKNLCDKARAAI